MIKWRIDKNNKVPLYLQLKDLVKYYISTGAIRDSQQLPGVNAMAKTLNINFETVRKAYKELEKEGLILMGRGKGTFATLHKLPKSQSTFSEGMESRPLESLKLMIKRFLQVGMGAKELTKVFKQALDQVCEEQARQTVIFTECNLHQVNEISEILKDYLGLNVRPVLLGDLETEVKTIAENNDRLLAIITTGFHISEVQETLKDTHVDIHVLITSMSPEAMRELISFDENTSFGFICRDEDSMVFYRDLLETQLGGRGRLSCCTMSEESKLANLLKDVDALLVTPPVYDEIKTIAPDGKPLFNVFDRVDPMSLKLIKDRILFAG